MILSLVASLLALQDSKFENSDYGVRLRIPPGWNIDGSRQARVIAKISPPGEFAVRPEILVYEIPFGEPITLLQYKEQLRHYIQRAFKEPRMLDDRPGEAAGRAGFCLEVQSKGTGDLDVVSVKGVFQRSPRRMIGVDAVFQLGKDVDVRKTYDAVLATLEFIPRKKPDNLEAGAKDVLDLLKTMAGPPAPAAAEVQELGLFVGDKQMGTYRVEIRPGNQGPTAGDEFRTQTKIDMGEDGRVETSISGFLSHDLSVQSAEVTEVKVGKDKRTQNFSAKITLKAGEAVVDRRINGEPSRARFQVPTGTILSELTEMLQTRLTGAQKRLYLLPMASAFDDEIAAVKIEISGLHKMKEGEITTDVHVSHLVREEGGVMTYWHGTDRLLQRVSAANQSFVIRRLK